jgi:hypothetical protein
LIPTGEQSGLQTHTATTESVSLCEHMKSWPLLSNLHRGDNRQRFIVRADELLTAFLELERHCAPT